SSISAAAVVSRVPAPAPVTTAARVAPQVQPTSQDLLDKAPVTFTVDPTSAASSRVVARGHAFTFFVTPSEAVLTFLTLPPPTARDARQPGHTTRGLTSRDVVRIATVGGNPVATVIPIDLTPATKNFLLGNDPTAWKSGVQVFGGAEVVNAYP